MINQSGQILVIVILTLGVVLFSTLFVIGGSQVYYQNSNYSVNSEKALVLAEAGLDKAVASLNKTGGSYSGETETQLGEGSYSVEIISKDAATKIVKATGYIPNKASPKSKRTVQIEATKGVGIAFNYGVQVGEGGLEMGNANKVIGSVYSNGNIIMQNSNEITGDAWVAGGAQPIANQLTDCDGVNCADYLFGKNISGQNILDVAQSFQATSSGTLNKVSIKLKKIGSPPQVTVRVLGNSGTNPNQNNILATGTLNNSLVTTNYGWFDVTFSTSPNLSADTTYWLMIDTSSDASNYWSWQNDLAQSYNPGSPKWSANWSAGSPVWNNFTGGGDLSFKVFMGGNITSIAGGNSDKVSGNAHVNTINNLTITGDAYYQTITNSTVGGSPCPNSHCHPGSVDPPPQVFPISEANITQWKQEAEAAGVTTGNITTCLPNLGPRKIVGNVTLGNGCTITVSTPIWITGNLTLGNSNTLRLNSSYGSTSGVIIVDGETTFDNGNKLEGSGQAGSILMLISTYDSRSNGNEAIQVNNTGNTGVLYANYGILDLGNSNSFKELTAWKLKLENSSTIAYEIGLASTLFSSGPSGSFTLVKGTYQVKQ